MNKFKCPHCGREVEVSQALTHQIEEEVVESLKVKHSEDISAAIAEAEQTALRKLDQKYLQEIKDAQIEANEEKERSRKLLTELEKLNDEIRLMRRKDEERELEMKRKLADEEESIRRDATKIERESANMDILELKKKLEDTQLALSDAQTKAKQGSQQLQGEVLELELEEKLRSNFVYDEIYAIGKGVQGADVLQTVKNPTGKVAGIILWETKRAKWTPSWIAKLKEDGRKNDATMVVLVSESLPKDIEYFKYLSGVLVCSNLYAIQLASLLRRSLMLIASAKFSVENKDENLQILYEYIQSDAFRHRFEAFADGIKAMEEDLLTERRSMERIWKKRETQLKRMQLNTSRMFGELQGVMQGSLPDIKTLSLDSGE